MKGSAKKNFMSPTISSASKAVAKRKKILGEKNGSEATEPTCARIHHRRSLSFDIIKGSAKKNFMSPTISSASKAVAQRKKSVGEKNGSEATEPTCARIYHSGLHGALSVHENVVEEVHDVGAGEEQAEDAGVIVDNALNRAVETVPEVTVTEYHDVVNELLDLPGEGSDASSSVVTDALNDDANDHTTMTMEETPLEDSTGEELEVGDLEEYTQCVKESVGDDETPTNLDEDEVSEMVSNPVMVNDGLIMRYAEENDKTDILDVVSALLLAFLGDLGFQKLRRSSKYLKEGGLAEQDADKGRSPVKVVTFRGASCSNLGAEGFKSGVGAPRVELFGEGVKGLGILATLPELFSSISKPHFDNILETFMTILNTKYCHASLWSQTTKELVLVGSYDSILHDSARMLSFVSIVIDKMILSISLADGNIPLQLKLDTVCDIGTKHSKFLLRIFQGLGDVMSAHLSAAKVNGNMNLAEIMNQIMRIYSSKVLPSFGEAGDSDDIMYQFALNILDHVERSDYQSISGDIVEKDIVMMAMKVAVGYCGVQTQSRILDKAHYVLYSSDPCLMVAFESIDFPSRMKVELPTEDLHDRKCRKEWSMSIFASVIVALRPQTTIPNERAVIHLLIISLLQGHIPPAQALGSRFNKLQTKTNEELVLVECCVEKLVALVCNDPPSNGFAWSCSNKANSSEEGFLDLSFRTEEASLVSVHAIRGLGWIAKGLLMRGHERANDIIRVLLSLLVNTEKLDALPETTGLLDDCRYQKLIPSIMETAVDAFALMMSDSDVCLNTRFHAIIRPLYKQRLLSTMTPIFLSAITKCDSSFARNMLYRAFAHVLSNAPLGAVLNDSRKLIPVLLECLSLLSKDASNKEIIHRLLLVLSAILTEESVAGQETVKENANIIINCLIGLAPYPHMMFVRETSIQCLTTLSRLPHTRVYPMKSLVLRVITKAVGDPKRAVRLQAVRCRQAWSAT